ncbi:hypothetical protein N7527_004036 [Penicillium freii]|nr:hypothetical protein N7527_004036 [Penicillium freii]
MYCLHAHLRRDPGSSNGSIHSTSAPPHHRTSAYPMQPSSRVGVHSRTRGHHTEKAEITKFPAHNPKDRRSE